ncbi:MAG: phosphate ABC transporter permease subunit PstC [bacterium]|nr:phosphate ABC transporter permease subunit PstC [bacterium]
MAALRLAALSTLLALVLIAIFILAEGLPLILHEGPARFILGRRWAPGDGDYGIGNLLAGTAWVTAGALLIGVPLGLSIAVFLCEVAPPPLAPFLKPAVELLAAIPSVVYGFVGLVTLVPLIRTHLGGPGFSVLACSLVLGVMILPTIASVTYDSLRAVPSAYREGSLALGAARWQTITRVLIPAARPGILAGIILGTGRALGETMAVLMVAGNALRAPTSPLDPVRTLTGNIALEMGYAAGEHRQALFATGVVLFLVIFSVNVVARALVRGPSGAR